MDGYRAFRVVGDDAEVFLRPASNGTAGSLEYPLLRAVCATDGAPPNSYGKGRHPAPQPGCDCGYHAYTKAGGATTYAGLSWQYGEMAVLAHVWGWGQVEQFSQGFRARYLQLVDFYWPFCLWDTCGGKAELCHYFDSDRGHGWPLPLFATCGEHDAPNYRTITSYQGSRDEPRSGHLIMPMEQVMRRLSERFEASVLDWDETQKLIDSHDAWTVEFKVEEFARREQRREEEQRRRNVKHEKRRAQMVMSLSDGDGGI